MNRDWLTLAFGVALVGAVVGLSLRQNMIRGAVESDPAASSAAGGDASASPSSASPAGAPASAPVRAASRPAGRASSSEASSTPVDTTVVLQVQSDVPGASVFLDREFVGTTPLTLRGLTTGARQLNVTATGHEGYAESITLAEGPNRVNVEFLKSRLNATVPVLHRHAMGSCQGMLVAAAKGISYDTSNKSDAFSVTFADLEAFDVDYLKKNLRVRRRAGKTWNFTSDNADALFVFHRDVAKARERLADAR